MKPYETISTVTNVSPSVSWLRCVPIFNDMYQYLPISSVTSLSPSSVSWAGAFVGEYHGAAHEILVTVTGLNFGPRFHVGGRWEALEGGGTTQGPWTDRELNTDWARGRTIRGGGGGGGDGAAGAGGGDAEASHGEVVVEFPVKGTGAGVLVACLDTRWVCHCHWPKRTKP
jgi:hypothetical protein